MNNYTFLTSAKNISKDAIHYITNRFSSVENNQILDPLSCHFRMALLSFKQPGTKISIHNNKILILVQVTCGGPSNERAGFRIFKDGSTAIGGGDASGNRLTGFGSVYRNDSNGIQSLPASVIDTPGDTNAHTYQVQVSILANTSYMYITFM